MGSRVHGPVVHFDRIVYWSTLMHGLGRSSYFCSPAVSTGPVLISRTTAMLLSFKHLRFQAGRTCEKHP